MSQHSESSVRAKLILEAVEICLFPRALQTCLMGGMECTFSPIGKDSTIGVVTVKHATAPNPVPVMDIPSCSIDHFHAFGLSLGWRKVDEYRYVNT